MESSEDDAGNATSASRRASAREKDIGQAEDVETTRDTQHEPPDASTSCRTPAMSEDNDDGDSVPSPSQQDVNTSTEAILDMIDEFVDGPGAPRRVPLTTLGDEAPDLNKALESRKSTDETEPKQQIDDIAEQSRSESPAPIDKSENPNVNTSVKSGECTSQSEDPICANKSSNVSSPPTSSASVDKTETSSNEQSENSSAVIDAEPSSNELSENRSAVINAEASSNEQSESGSAVINAEPSSNEQSENSSAVIDAEPSSNEQSENSCAVISAELELSAIQSVSDSPSSSIQTVQDTSNVSECEQSEQLERTVKCVTSSDNRDSVTVERAESTSSECSVSESRGFPVEPQSKSPLKRRLVRPVPSDRRPDSTVSSTVDSQTAKIHKTQPISCDVLVKDVSSSSDALPLQHGKVKPEEISNVSEISICKAETSTAPKKIRLVRPKVTPVLSNSNKNEALSPEKKQCQSTSPDDHPRPLFPVEPTTSKEVTHKSKQHDKKSAPVKSALSNDSIKVSEPLPHAKSEAKEIVISNIENAIQSVSATSSEPTTIRLETDKSVDVEDTTESVVVETQPKMTIPEKSKEIALKPIEPVQVCSNPPYYNVVETAQKELNKETQSDKPELSQDQSIMLSEAQSKVTEPISDTSQESIQVVTHSMSSPPTESQLQTLESAQVLAEELKTKETLSNVQKTAEIQLKKSEKQCLIVEPNPIERQSENVESTVAKSEDPISTSSEELESKKVEATQDLFIMPTESQSKLSKQKGNAESNELKSSQDQTKLPEVSESKSIPILEATVSKIEVLKPEKSQQGSLDSQVPPDSIKATQTEVTDLKPVEVQSKTMRQEAESKSADSKVPESTGSLPKAVKSTESSQKLVEPTVSEVLEQNKCQSKVLQRTENQEKVLEPASALKVVGIQSVSESINAPSELLDQSKSQTVQSKSILVPEAEDNNQLKKTIIDLMVDSGSKELKKEKKSLDADDKTKKSELVYPKESQPMDIEPEILKKQTVEVQSNALDGIKKLPPIILTLTKASKTEKQINDSEAQSSKNVTVISNQDKQVQQVSVSNAETSLNCIISSNTDYTDEVSMDQKKVKPIKLNFCSSDHNSSLQSSPQKSNAIKEKPDSTKQVPKLTIKLGNKPAEEIKSPIPKLTIKPIRPPVDQKTEDFEIIQEIPSVTKLNIKPIVKPQEENVSPEDTDSNDQANRKEKIPSITKLNIKPIPKPAEKINDMHRKSSSSEISESEYSENDETSTSDQTSASDQGPSDTVPKVTIKLGKPGTECEGKFYTEKNIPKLTIKGFQQNENDEKDAKLKLVISQSEDLTTEKIPKLTIKTVTKSEGQPLSPKLTIKPIKPLENDNEIPKLKITTDAFGSCSEIKENMHVPKITIKAVTKTDSDINTKTPKKSTVVSDSPDHIPIVTKLNIKPISKPAESEESSEELGDKVPVVSKLNIKPIVKPKDNEIDSSVEDVPKIIKLNIKPLKNPEENSSEGKDCDENVVDKVDNIPIVTKLNIKPIIKPEEEDEGLKDSENQSSETGTSSDDNSDHIPVVTKLNIKPIIKPSEKEDPMKPVPNEQSIPVVTKLNIKPLVKPEDNTLPSSPKRESLRSPGSSGIPNVTKLNIKPIVKHEDNSENKIEDILEKSTKNPPLVMKINMKNVCENLSDQKYNSYVDGTKSPRQPMSPRLKKSNLTPDRDNLKSLSVAASVEPRKDSPDSSSLTQTIAHSSIATYRYCLPEINESKNLSIDINQVPDQISSNRNAIQSNEVHERKSDMVASPLSPGSAKQKKSLQNCTLLKQLLSNTKDDSEKSREMNMSNCSNSEKSDVVNCNTNTNVKTLVDEIRRHNSDLSVELGRRSPVSELPNDLSHSSKTSKTRSIQDVRKDANESVTKPLEIVTDKISNQSSGQDSPRIILKINKTDHGPSSKIITEECHRPKDSSQNHTENTHETSQEKPSPKKQYVNSRKKQAADEAVSLTIGKRLRSSRVVETPEKPPIIIRRNAGKRPSVSETSPSPTKETELSVLDSKRLKLEQILSVNKGLTITPVASNFTQTPPKPQTEVKPNERKNYSLLNSDNSKNGNSKLHNILSNLQAKQMQSLKSSEASILNKDPIIIPDAESNTSTGSSDVVVEISRIENCHPNVQEMIINENIEFREISTPDEVSQDPLEVDALKTAEEVTESAIMKAVEVTPTPRKRGRPRKIPLSEGAKPTTPAPLPTTALEERPQRSLRLMRERPAVRSRPRGRGRGRGGRRAASPIAAPSHASDEESTETVIVIETLDEDEPQRPPAPPRPVTPEDPTSSRIKLPRMTEALDKSSACMTPLSSRRRSTDMKMFCEPTVVLESPIKIEEFMKSPDAKGSRGRGGRGRTPRGRTPRGRGRGRGGGKGATYMKETMGIYGRVCGPATTTVELFEEETCMMDDNATPSKPSHLLDEDSQSSVKSSTNEGSNKMKKSKFADLFDSNKVWTAADVKEYTWPPNDVPNVEHQVMMIQEQVAMFLGVKSFKRRYAELKRRAVVGEEKDYCLRRGIVTEALCDLGITAVDASDVLDIMLSDYPHKYEEYRSYQRQRQLTEPLVDDSKMEEKPKIEMKSEKTSDKPEPPKVDPEKTRQDMAAAAIASAVEWNAMANAWRRGACADLQSNTIHRRRPPATVAPTHCRPPHGFYPHAVLPGQYQHSYVRYTPEQLRYFPLNTVIAAPPAPPSPAESSTESEGSWDESSSSSDDSHAPHHSAKRKKLTKVKRSSQHDKDSDSRGPDEVVDLCRVCKLRLEANRKYTHERFLVCAQCNAKFHPSCVDLGADTIRKCREYAWACAECKRCSGCAQPPADKMAACELCDRAFHLPCAGLAQPPTGRWHCVECAVCKSCGARSPGGPTAAGSADADWHHQTRRGPGGHKVYSHSLCTPCARAYRIGRYCPLCERSFIGPKGTMQLVICKLCDRQLHQECVRATVSSLNVLDYRCGDCRRGGITSRAGAVRAAPRTIATLFMAKRRFNKYAHKQYMQSRVRPASPDRDPLDPDNSRTDFGD